MMIITYNIYLYMHYINLIELLFLNWIFLQANAIIGIISTWSIWWNWFFCSFCYSLGCCCYMIAGDKKESRMNQASYTRIYGKKTEKKEKFRASSNWYVTYQPHCTFKMVDNNYTKTKQATTITTEKQRLNLKKNKNCHHRGENILLQTLTALMCDCVTTNTIRTKHNKYQKYCIPNENSHTTITSYHKRALQTFNTRVFSHLAKNFREKI